MKKFAVLCFVLTLMFATAVPAMADADKTVDGSGERWEQESSDVSSLATMTWDSAADTLHFSGTGYKDRAGMKFGFRCKIAFDTADVSVTLRFPETFNALYSESNNMHFALSLVNTWSRWWNTDGNDVKSAAFIIRPQSQNTVSVELAGRWGLGAAGYGDISETGKTEFTLNEAREMTFGFKKEEESFAAYIGDEKFAALDKELSGGVICDGLGSSIAALFGVLPNTSFSQNVGLVTMTKVVNRMALATGAVFLILCGLIPKLGAIVSIMPQSVLGGAAVMMFSSIVVSGIQLITKEKMTSRNLTIVSVALGVGYGMGAHATILSKMPEAIQLVFGGSGIVPAAFMAIILNVLLPKDEA